jgi:hypothetical protein
MYRVEFRQTRNGVESCSLLLPKAGHARSIVLREFACEELFNADKALRRDGNVFCSTKCARQWGKARSMPTLQTFLEDRFVPDAETTHKDKVKTIKYYRQGAAMLKRSRLASLRLDELTGEHVGWFASENRRLSPSGINMGLRTLRRALNLAYAWGVIEKPGKVELAKGENQRDRVLSTSNTVRSRGRMPPRSSRMKA